jgi:hypothetical protein
LISRRRGKRRLVGARRYKRSMHAFERPHPERGRNPGYAVVVSADENGFLARHLDHEVAGWEPLQLLRTEEKKFFGVEIRVLGLPVQFRREERDDARVLVRAAIDARVDRRLASLAFCDGRCVMLALALGFAVDNCARYVLGVHHARPVHFVRNGDDIAVRENAFAFAYPRVRAGTIEQ